MQAQSSIPSVKTQKPNNTQSFSEGTNSRTMKLTSKLETILFSLLFGERGKNFHMKEAHCKVQVKKPMSQRDNIQFLPYHGYFYISYKHTRILIQKKKTY